MDSKTTHDILKYGVMYPDKVRDIITTYMEDRNTNDYYTEWEDFVIKEAVDSKTMKTHFFRIWVYNDSKYNETVFGFIPRNNDYVPALSRWTNVSQGILCVDVTDDSEEEVYTKFHEYYEELNQVCLQEEYNNNYPEGGFEHDGL